MKKIIVIGGGAAGMLAALFAADNGASVNLLESNEKLGKKVYITGKGRCNVTNAGDREAFMTAIRRNPRFFFAAFANFDNHDMMDLMEDLGVPLKVERGNRVFPVSDRANDITTGIRRELERLGVEINLNTRVEKLIIEDGSCRGVETNGGHKLYADAVIICTGGRSYPSTGSTGDGYRFALQAGHHVTNTIPSLVPIDTKESWPAMLAGLSLKNVALRSWKEGAKKKKYFFDEQGEMMFTHEGITGPLVLSLSAQMPEEMSDVRMMIDLKPALDDAILDARLLREFKENSRKQLTHVMDTLVPHNLGNQLLILAGISGQTPVNTVTAEQREKIRRILKNLPLTPKCLRGFEEAIVTRGGIDVRGVDPSTMESKIVKELYFAGEVLDLDAETGGFNLQIAFSTGALAGKSAALKGEQNLH